MRVVADTNTVVSGLLWHGAPHKILECASRQTIQLFTCSALLKELEEVLQRDKFARYLNYANVTPNGLVTGYTMLANLVESATIAPVIFADPDDDIVLACAVVAHAHVIVSGDSHLLNLGQYQNIQIITATDLLSKIGISS